MATKPASMGAMVFEAVRAQERALEMSQGWSENVLAPLNRRPATSQAEATKALAESLERSRKVVSTAMSTQQHSVERVESFVGGVLGALSGQLQTMRTHMELGQGMLADPGAAPSKMFLQMTQDWMDAYGQLLEATSMTSRRESKS